MSSKPRRPSSDDDRGRSASGTPIGVCLDGKARNRVCIPTGLRPMHVHILGLPGAGKTTLMEAMLLDDIRQGVGVAVIDPHGVMTSRLLRLLPSEAVERSIHFNLGDPEWVPIWNPLRCGADTPSHRVTEAMIDAFQVLRSSWDPRIEHLLRHAFFAVGHLPGGHLLNVVSLLRKWSPESRRLRRRLLQLISNECSQRFWRDDFNHYGKAELLPLLCTLGKLFLSHPVGAMLSQDDSAFSLRDVMDTGGILLVNLSNMSPEAGRLLGCLFVSLLHLAALARSDRSEETHRAFHIYCGDAHRFIGDTTENLFMDTRRSRVSLTLSHQYLSQFNARQRDALSAFGSTIIFRVGGQDASYLEKRLQGKVTAEDLTTLDVGQAVVRISGHVVRIQTPAPLVIPKDHQRDRIIARSHQLYCRSAKEVRSIQRLDLQGDEDSAA